MHLLNRRFVPFLVCLLLVAAGCTAWRLGTQEPLRFSHEKMLHQSVECADCHTQAATGDKAGMPDLATCQDCHEDIDKIKPKDRSAASLFESAGFRAAKVTEIPSEIIFSHKTHTIDHKVTCTECHQGIEKSTAVSKDLGLGMQDCIACHEQKAKTVKPVKTAGGAEDCALCHKDIRKDLKPTTHLQNWLRFHGQKARDGDQEGLNQCSYCHAQDSCDSCHKTQAPANHTSQWRERGHGVAASIDRDTCTTCHQSDTCTSCHKTTAPRTHRGQWGEPKDKHCQNCHIPVDGERCSVCHQEGTPSHARATPTPASMVGTDCRTCHGTAPNAQMPHVDNGDDCNYCHH